MHEARYFEKKAFLTLTYATPKLPANNSLVKSHLQDFIKRLRINLWRKYKITGTKFFACGEYGEEKGRPHYHVVFLGYDFPDKVPIQNNPWATSALYDSKELEEYWTHGRVTLGEVTEKSAAYTAAYTMKKLGGEDGDAAYRRQKKEPPFNLMSQGVGSRFFNQFMDDIYPADRCRSADMVAVPVPRYYDKKLQQKEDEFIGPRLPGPGALEQIKQKRKEKIEAVDPNEFSKERLATKEHIRKSRLKQMRRRLEAKPDAELPKRDDSLKLVLPPARRAGFFAP